MKHYNFTEKYKNMICKDLPKRLGSKRDLILPREKITGHKYIHKENDFVDKFCR